MSVNKQQVIEILRRIAETLEEHKQYLTDLDAAIGDGDHGTNMSRGFGQVAEKLQNTEFDTIADVVKMTAMTLISTVGGASGPLYGSFFLKAAGEVKDKEAVGISEFNRMFGAGAEGVRQRGKSQTGEKTMLDVLIPVHDFLLKCQEENKSGTESLHMAAQSARILAEETKDIRATKGRAAYLGERSIGHIDPGAMSSCLMIEAISKYLMEMEE